MPKDSIYLVDRQGFRIESETSSGLNLKSKTVSDRQGFRLQSEINNDSNQQKERGRELEEELAEARDAASLLREHNRHLELLGSITAAAGTSYGRTHGAGGGSFSGGGTSRTAPSGSVRQPSIVMSSRGGQHVRDQREGHPHHGADSLVFNRWDQQRSTGHFRPLEWGWRSFN